MDCPAPLRPLVAGSTWRRGVFLLLGGVLALPYALLGVAFAQLFTNPGPPRLLVLVLLVPAAGIAIVPIFLGGSRALEIAAVRGLLGVDVPEPMPGHRLDRETRLRAALWIGLHLTSGALVVAALFSVVPMALAFIAAQAGMDVGISGAERFGPFDGGDTGWLALLAVLVLAALGYVVAGLGALAASMAPALLGPASAERIAALEARAARLAERNRLARELHDSVGHALTVATLQAGAAREVLDGDPEFVRRALTAIEETGRRAMDDLDHMLGLLRETGEPSAAAPQRTLSDLDELIAITRSAGTPVRSRGRGSLDALPAVVSREGYRIVQEGLTNAARHGHGPVTVRVDVSPDGLEIELVNAVARSASGGAAVPGGGRGLIGMRERVLLLGGRVTAGVEGERWRVRVRLPIGADG
ncbi:histidine kinase [Verrucosispora sp. WMMA2121]|uniref:sensor histidine kinase n=1 Tax=Verrucosispora sp. WMMA2121 TaxID=3015164 RepID=UPI0022B74D64|nr:histidine kinase [Verrucosispora sp. WMMA2121]MCZ7420743.1 histidine kinase [Verrucosispora sp. WMMA2121]